MTQSPLVGTDTQLQNFIDLALAGDKSAHDALLRYAGDRLLRLTRKMFRREGRLRRWEETDDVFQNAMLRLQRALAETRVESVRHFFNLAALQIRRELIGLGRHHFGAHGDAAHHHTDGQPADDEGGSLHRPGQEPDNLEDWIAFHSTAKKLPHDLYEVFDLVYYDGLTQEEAARVMGVSVRTVKRRWQEAKLRLHEELSVDRRR